MTRPRISFRAVMTLGITAALMLVGSCGKGDDTISGPVLPVGSLIASDPRPVVTARSASLSPADTMAPDVAYVSLPPGSAPAQGRLATLINLRSDDTVLAPVADGGFDPAAIPAIAGDTIAVEVRDADQSVVFEPPVFVVRPKARPVVVRTHPPPRKRDVPLNTQVVVVFSEPVDMATVTSSTVQLHRGSSLVAGTLQFRDSEHVTIVFRPALLLAAATNYTLTVSGDIQDLDGDLLETPVTVEFTTATTGGYEEYFVDATAPLSADQVGDSVIVDHTLRVFNSIGVGIEGAVVHFRVSTGIALPDTTDSGLGGLTSGQWRFAGIIGVLPAEQTAELAACASNSLTRCDQYWPLLLIGFNPP